MRKNIRKSQKGDESMRKSQPLAYFRRRYVQLNRKRTVILAAELQKSKSGNNHIRAFSQAVKIA
jgi:hypothetical protein